MRFAQLYFSATILYISLFLNLFLSIILCYVCVVYCLLYFVYVYRQYERILFVREKQIFSTVLKSDPIDVISFRLIVRLLITENCEKKYLVENKSRFDCRKDISHRCHEFPSNKEREKNLNCVILLFSPNIYVLLNQLSLKAGVRQGRGGGTPSPSPDLCLVCSQMVQVSNMENNCCMSTDVNGAEASRFRLSAVSVTSPWLNTTWN